MKDIIITRKRITWECIIFIGCFVVAELANLYAIIKYTGNWSELYMSLGFVITATILLYIVLAILRLLVYGIIRLFRKSK